jgi:hypothetical protein
LPKQWAHDRPAHSRSHYADSFLASWLAWNHNIVDETVRCERERGAVVQDRLDGFDPMLDGWAIEERRGSNPSPSNRSRETHAALREAHHRLRTSCRHLSAFRTVAGRRECCAAGWSGQRAERGTAGRPSVCQTSARRAAGIGRHRLGDIADVLCRRNPPCWRMFTR